MTIADQLQEARFKGREFLVPSESESGGKKVAIHEYPGTSDRFVEELGRRLPTFNVTAILHGLNVVQQRDRFTATLVSDGPGILIHPYLGQVRVSVVDYTVRTSDTSLGQVIYDIEFVQTRERLSLQAFSIGPSAVFSSAKTARSALDVAVLGRYRPLRVGDSIRQLASRAREAISSIQSELSTTVNPVQDALNEVTRGIVLNRQDAFSIVRTPQRLTEAFRGIFDSALSLGQTPAFLRDQWSALTNFGAAPRFLGNGQRSRTVGSVRTPIQRSIQKRILEDDNLRVLDQYIRIEALINSMESEAGGEFATDTALALARSRIESDFQRIILNHDDVIASSNLGDEVLTDANIIFPSTTVSEAIAFAGDLAFDANLRAALETLRVDTLSVLTRDVKNPYALQTIDLGLVDIQIAAHQLYGNQDLSDVLVSLNSDQNLSLMRSPVKSVLP